MPMRARRRERLQQRRRARDRAAHGAVRIPIQRGDRGRRIVVLWPADRSEQPSESLDPRDFNRHAAEHHVRVQLFEEPGVDAFEPFERLARSNSCDRCTAASASCAQP